MISVTSYRKKGHCGTQAKTCRRQPMHQMPTIEPDVRSKSAALSPSSRTPLQSARLSVVPDQPPNVLIVTAIIPRSPEIVQCTLCKYKSADLLSARPNWTRLPERMVSPTPRQFEEARSKPIPYLNRCLTKCIRQWKPIPSH